MKKNKLLIIILIFIFAFLIRIINLQNNPNGFFCDEASIGYNAYSILTTGKDEHGSRFPLFFQAFGEYKNPIMIYSMVPFIKIFGLNIFSVRLPAIIYGLLSILALYLLLNLIFDINTALWGAFILSLMPWHFHFSRFNFEGLMPYITFAMLGMYFWFLYLKNLKLKTLFLSLLFFALSLYSYFPARITIPLFCFILVVIYFKNINKKHYFFIIITTFLLILPMLIHLMSGTGMSRWHQVGGQFNIQKLFQQYPKYYSIDYLFKKGDIDFFKQNVTRQSVRGIGELFYFQLPLIIFGLYYLFKNNRRFFYLMISALLVFPLADILTDSSSPQAVRTIFGIIPFAVLSAVGLKQFFIIIKPKIFTFLLIIIALLSFNKFWQLFKLYPQYSSDFWGWQYGPQEIIPYFINQSNNYDQLCLEGAFNGSEIFIKFFDPYNKCQGKCRLCSPEVYDSSKRQLFAVNANYNYDETKFKIKHIVFYPNSKIAFKIISNHD